MKTKIVLASLTLASVVLLTSCGEQQGGTKSVSSLPASTYKTSIAEAAVQNVTFAPRLEKAHVDALQKELDKMIMEQGDVALAIALDDPQAAYDARKTKSESLEVIGFLKDASKEKVDALKARTEAALRSAGYATPDVNYTILGPNKAGQYPAMALTPEQHELFAEVMKKMTAEERFVNPEAAHYMTVRSEMRADGSMSPALRMKVEGLAEAAVKKAVVDELGMERVAANRESLMSALKVEHSGDYDYRRYAEQGSEIAKALMGIANVRMEFNVRTMSFSLYGMDSGTISRFGDFLSGKTNTEIRDGDSGMIIKPRIGGGLPRIE